MLSSRLPSIALTRFRISLSMLATLPLLLGGNAAQAGQGTDRGTERRLGTDEEPFAVKSLALQRLNDARDAIHDHEVEVGDRHEALHELDDAIDELEDSMEPKLWLREDGEIEGSRLDRKHGEHVFHEERDCIEEIFETIDDGEIEDEGMVTKLHTIITDLVLVDRRLAEIAIDDALAAEGCPDELKEAFDCLKYGDELVQDAVRETCPRKQAKLIYKAVDHAYRHAWKEAMDAMRCDCGYD